MDADNTVAGGAEAFVPGRALVDRRGGDDVLSAFSIATGGTHVELVASSEAPGGIAAQSRVDQTGMFGAALRALRLGARSQGFQGRRVACLFVSDGVGNLRSV